MPWVHNASPETEAASCWRTVLGVCLSLTIAMTAVVATRFYFRIRRFGRLSADDWIILASAVSSIVYSALAIDQTRWGLGLPVDKRPQEDRLNYSVVNFAGRPFYMVAITGFKVALCITYLQIARRSAPKFFRLIIWVVLLVCLLAHSASTLVLIFRCNPPAKSWDEERYADVGSCLSQVSVFYALAGITIFFDVLIFLLPVPLIHTLPIERRDKIGLAGLFLLCCITTAASILRMVQIRQVDRDGNSTGLVLWGTIEANVGIALSSIPHTMPLLKNVMDRLRVHGTSTSSSRLSKFRNDSLGDASQLRSSEKTPQPRGRLSWSRSRRNSVEAMHSDKPSTKATTASRCAEEQPEDTNDVVTRVIHRATEIDVYEVYWPNAQRQAAIDERW